VLKFSKNQAFCAYKIVLIKKACITKKGKKPKKTRKREKEKSLKRNNFDEIFK